MSIWKYPLHYVDTAWWDDEKKLSKETHFYRDPERTLLAEIRRYDKDGKLGTEDEDDDEPTVQCFFKDGTMEAQIWLRHSETHRVTRDPETGLTLPANIVFNPDGSTKKSSWFRNGRPHRADRDPATGVLLPAFEDRDFERWALINYQDVVPTPDHPGLLAALAEWETEHGVSGLPTTKSALKN